MRKFTLFLALFFAWGLAAQDQQEEKITEWTLASCIEHAWENSLSVMNADVARQNSEIAEKLASHARYPSLSGSTNLFFNFGRTIDPTQNEFVTTTFISNGLSLNTGMTLYNAGRINNTIKQSAIDTRAAQLDLDQIKNDIALQVGTAYINVLFAIENLKNSELQLELSEQQLRQTQELIDIGSRPANERLDIESQIAQREQTVIINQNALDNAYLQLKQLLRLDFDYEMTLEIPDNVEVISDISALTYKEVLDAALKTQKNVAANELRVSSAELGVKIANAGRYPTIGIGGQVGTNYSNQARSIENINRERINTNVFIDGNPAILGTDQNIPSFVNTPYATQLDENLSYGFGLNVSIPIYNNYSARANVQRAKLGIVSSRITLDQTVDLVKNNVQQALANARAARLSLIASQKSVDALKASYENAQERYKLGGINGFELTSIQNQLDVAEINLIISKYDYLFRSKVIDFYMGKPIRLN